MLFISLLHIIHKKNKFNFIKYKLISKCTYIFCVLCFSVERLFSLYFIIEDLKKKKSKNLVSSRSREPSSLAGYLLPMVSI